MEKMYNLSSERSQMSASSAPVGINVEAVRERYLSLLSSCLTGSIYEDAPLQKFNWKEFDASKREMGYDWPSQAHSMIGVKRMKNLRALCEKVIEENIPGDFIETGVWRGGACILMRGILASYGITDRTVWVADSFEGLPAPDVEQYPSDEGENFHEYEELAISLEQVQDNFRKYGLLDEQVKFLKGWFKDTLHVAPIRKLAILRLDGDLYESTIQALDALYDKLAVGGYAIIDDYHVVLGCRKAVHDFFDKHNIAPELHEIDGVGVYWKKQEN